LKSQGLVIVNFDFLKQFRKLLKEGFLKFSK